MDAVVANVVTYVAHALDAHMTTHGLSTRDVARAAGVSVGTVHAVRAGTTRIEASTVARLEAALSIALWPRPGEAHQD